MDEPVNVKDAEDAYEMPDIKGEVEYRNVTFAYEEGKNILENVSFTVKPGESIALVGPTGAGKTTVVNLLSRFYDLTGGAVYIDGNDISKVTLHSLRDKMGIMMQDSFIFSGTIEDNIVRHQVLSDVKKLVKHLPDNQREVLEMRYYQDLSFKEIADITGVSINTALGRMRYAILNMRRMADENRIELSMV